LLVFHGDGNRPVCQLRSERSIEIGKKEIPPCPGTTSVLLAGCEPFVGVWLPGGVGAVRGEVPWLKYVATVSRPWEDSDWKGETGRVDDLLRKYAHEWGLRAEETTVICVASNDGLRMVAAS